MLSRNLTETGDLDDEEQCQDGQPRQLQAQVLAAGRGQRGELCEQAGVVAGRGLVGSLDAAILASSDAYCFCRPGRFFRACAWYRARAAPCCWLIVFPAALTAPSAAVSWLASAS